MSNKVLGWIKCPVCDKPALLKVTIKNKPYCNCAECGSQTFSRGVDSAKLLKGKIYEKYEDILGTGDATSAGSIDEAARKAARIIKDHAGGVGRNAGDIDIEKMPIPAAANGNEPKPAPKVTVRTHSSEGETVVEELTIFDRIGKVLNS